MLASPARQDFVVVPTEMEGDSPVTARTFVNRRVRPKTGRLNFCMAIGATLLLAGVVAFKMRHVPTSMADETSVIIEHEVKKAGPLKAFKQCGGAAWEGPTCCMKGCACVKESKYYSGCHAPAGLDQCDPGSVKDEAAAAKQRMDEAKVQQRLAQAHVKEAEDFLAESTKKSEEAEAEAQRAIEEGLKKKKEKEEAKEKLGGHLRELQEAAENDIEKVTKAAHEEKMKKVNAAKEKTAKVEKTAAAEKEASAKKAKQAWGKEWKAQHALDLKMKEGKDVEREIYEYKKKEDMRKSTNCGGAYADCTKTWCCALGCECQGDKYYGQCKGINGKVGFCDSTGAAAKHTEAMTKHDKHWEEVGTLNKTLQDEKKTANELSKKAAEIKVDADKKIASVRKAEEETIQAASKVMEKAVSDAKEKWEKKLAPAREELDEKLASFIRAASRAGTARVKALKFAERKKRVKASAERSVREKKDKARDAKADIGMRREALETWERVAKGETCDESPIMVRKLK